MGKQRWLVVAALVFALTAKALQRSRNAAIHELTHEISPALQRLPLRRG